MNRACQNASSFFYLMSSAFILRINLHQMIRVVVTNLRVKGLVYAPLAAAAVRCPSRKLAHALLSALCSL